MTTMMMRKTASFAVAFLGVVAISQAAALIACGGEELNANPGRSTASAAADGGGASDDGSDGINRTGVGAGTGANTGLPCDVQQLLENRCIGCHLTASPPPLLTYDDLLKPAPSNPSKTMAQSSLERMSNTAAPMPPAPATPATADEIASLQAWIAANTPKGAECTGLDGGTLEGGAATTVFNTPSVCTSQKTWKGGNEGSGSMRPGGACVTCHTMRGGPAFQVAGTVYPTGHEPNDCNGVTGAGTLAVIVTGADGVITKLTVNSVGNFSSKGGKIKAPFHVKVSDGTKERVMSASLTAGDCNSCHTEAGVNGAPGRVVAP